MDYLLSATGTPARCYLLVVAKPPLIGAPRLFPAIIFRISDLKGTLWTDDTIVSTAVLILFLLLALGPNSSLPPRLSREVTTASSSFSQLNLLVGP